MGVAYAHLPAAARRNLCQAAMMANGLGSIRAGAADRKYKAEICLSKCRKLLRKRAKEKEREREEKTNYALEGPNVTQVSLGNV